MRILRGIKSNFLIIAVLVMLVFWCVDIFNTQTEVLLALEAQRSAREFELESAKMEYERLLFLQKTMNTGAAKEDQIRERLNMIKKDEIQFIFSK